MNYKILYLLVFLFSNMCYAQKKESYNSFKQDSKWLDNKGDFINAHGGGITSYGGKYYWFGEHKGNGKSGKAMVGISVYSSKDLYNWKNKGIALKVIKNNPSSPICAGSIIERPKVIYNKKNNNFVMWFHLEKANQGYKAALTGVATSKSITGPYTFLKALRPNKGCFPINFTSVQKKARYPKKINRWSKEGREDVKAGMFLNRDLKGGQMSRDMSIYIDDNGKAYHIHSSEDNATIHISELNDDYTGFTGKYIRVAPGGANEAPAIFKTSNGNYYMITSGCTGWAPNAGRLWTTKNIMGNWKYIGNPFKGINSKTSFKSQSTYILPLKGKKDAFIYIGDRWKKDNLITSGYIWLPILFDSQKTPYINWIDNWNINRQFK